MLTDKGSFSFLAEFQIFKKKEEKKKRLYNLNPDQCHHGQKQLYPKFQRTPRNSEVSLSIAFCQLRRSRRESILNNGFQSNKTQVTGKIVLPTVSWQAKQIISADAVDSTRISLICIPVIDAINYLKVRLAPLMMIAW